MSLRKKIILSIGMMVTMLVTIVIGLTINCVNNNPQPVNDNESTNVVKVEKPLSYTYKPGEIVVKKGVDIINYKYVPVSNATTANTTAYEYAFGNATGDKMAVYLNAIDTTGVNISYVYSDEQIDTTSEITGETNFSIQTIESKEDIKYVYILVTPSNLTIPVDFSTKVKWSYGKAVNLTISNNLNTDTVTATLIARQSIDESLMPTMEAPTGYYFDAWFLDDDFTQLATFPLDIENQTLYARFHNLPTNVTTYTAYDLSTGTYGLSNCKSGLPTNLIVPTMYNNGTNGKALIKIINSSAFSGNTTINSIVLPFGLTEIKDNAFLNTTSLQTIDFNSCINLQTIGVGAFGTSAVIDVKLPNSVVDIGTAVFKNCSALTNIKLSKEITTLSASLFEGCSVLENVDLSKCSKLTAIASDVFKGCSALASIYLPNSLTSIGSSAFYNCTSLENITIPYGVTSISANTFYGCVGLSNIDLLACINMESVGESAFRNCSSLSKIILPAKVATIGADAFNGCVSLEMVLLPLNLQTINNYTFKGCASLSKIEIPKSVLKIGAYTFQNCTALNEIIFEDLTIWYKTTNNTYTEGEVIELANSTQNATWFKGTSGYYNNYLYKQENISRITLSANGGTYNGVEVSEDYLFDVNSGELNYSLSNEASYDGNVFNLSDGYYIRKGTAEHAWNDYACAKITFTANAGDIVSFEYVLSYDDGVTHTALFGGLDSYFEYEGLDLISGDIYKTLSGSYSGTVSYPINTTGEHYIYVVHSVDYLEVMDKYAYMQIKSTALVEYPKYNIADIYKTDGQLGSIATPVRDGYTFAGWFTDPLDGVRVTSETVINSDIKLYAHWTKN